MTALHKLNTRNGTINHGLLITQACKNWVIEICLQYND